MTKFSDFVTRIYTNSTRSKTWSLYLGTLAFDQMPNVFGAFVEVTLTLAIFGLVVLHFVRASLIGSCMLSTEITEGPKANREISSKFFTFSAFFSGL